MASALATNNFFVANDSTDRSGVRLTMQDVAGDGKADLVTDSGDGLSSAVRACPSKPLVAATGMNGVEPTILAALDRFGSSDERGVHRTSRES